MVKSRAYVSITIIQAMLAHQSILSCQVLEGIFFTLIFNFDYLLANCNIDYISKDKPKTPEDLL